MFNKRKFFIILAAIIMVAIISVSIFFIIQNQKNKNGNLNISEVQTGENVGESFVEVDTSTTGENEEPTKVNIYEEFYNENPPLKANEQKEIYSPDSEFASSENIQDKIDYITNNAYSNNFYSTSTTSKNVKLEELLIANNVDLSSCTYYNISFSPNDNSFLAIIFSENEISQDICNGIEKLSEDLNIKEEKEPVRAQLSNEFTTKAFIMAISKNPEFEQTIMKQVAIAVPNL